MTILMSKLNTPNITMKRLHEIFHVTTSFGEITVKWYSRMRASKIPDPDPRSTTPLVTLRFSIDHDSNLAIQSIVYDIFIPLSDLVSTTNAVTVATCRNQCSHNELTVIFFYCNFYTVIISLTGAHCLLWKRDPFTIHNISVIIEFVTIEFDCESLFSLLSFL